MELQAKIVSSYSCHPNRKARIMLRGNWLLPLGFGVETLVTVIADNGVVTMKAHGIGLEVYRQLVREVRQKGHQLLQVVNKTEHRTTLPSLTLQGDWLETAGFAIDDLILVCAREHHIQIRRLPSADNHNLQNKLLTVYSAKTNGGGIVPMISFSGSWLKQIGFPIGQLIKVSYGTNEITFRPDCTNTKLRRQLTKPMQVAVVHGCRQAPCFLIRGMWLEQEGFSIGDKLLVHYQQGFIRIKRLDKSLFYAI